MPHGCVSIEDRQRDQTPFAGCSGCPVASWTGRGGKIVDVNRRGQLLSLVADRLTATEIGRPVRVGVDGPCGSGKSTLARELVQEMSSRARRAVHLDSDGFHNRRDIRYRQGRDSARGYYDDGYDFAALIERVLIPLGPGGSRVYATKVHDMATDRAVTDRLATAPEDAIVVFDCTFLQRGSLREHWDEVIYLEVRRDISVARGAARDAAMFGGVENARRAYEDRYMAACDIYIREECPAEKASVVIDHNEIAMPRVLRGLKAYGTL